MNATNRMPLPSLGIHASEAKTMAALLTNLQSGMDAYIRVFDGLERKYGREFHSFFIAEVSR